MKTNMFLVNKNNKYHNEIQKQYYDNAALKKGFVLKDELTKKEREEYELMCILPNT